MLVKPDLGEVIENLKEKIARQNGHIENLISDFLNSDFSQLDQSEIQMRLENILIAQGVLNSLKAQGADIARRKSEQDAEDAKTFKDRLAEERAQLDKRIISLDVFLSSDKVKDIPDEQVNLLRQQIDAMREYYDILSKRFRTL